ncbi:Uncharacterised protein [Serratia rubidaea]|uniref:Uncharacterized protein n=1 Tax=Serratia rubidaea TaxID=61652 RepID=A0A3S4JR33_SERRU|nr:Uncharacterised protein [Serratia rubidaea]
MKLTQFKNGSRLAIPAIFAALFIVASTITLYYYSATLSKRGCTPSPARRKTTRGRSRNSPSSWRSLKPMWNS